MRWHEMNNDRPARIYSKPGDLKEGLFGQVLLFVFEVLPYLDKQDVLPDWAIRSKLYGNADDGFIVIPGLLDLNYKPVRPAGKKVREIRLKHLRKNGTATLGNDWCYLNRLWSRYFRIPERVVERADAFPDLGLALGLHYRGTDKNASSNETNYVSESDFMALATDFIRSHPGIRLIFIASDEPGFADRVRDAHPSLEIVSSGDVVHHKDKKQHDNLAKGDHAVLDCLLLSRCKYLVKCQSALSGFAKVLNPEIEAYRISANKLTPWAPETPYFPDAYLPMQSSEDRDCRAILDRLFSEDWTENRRVYGKFRESFPFRERERVREIPFARKFRSLLRRVKGA